MMAIQAWITLRFRAVKRVRTMAPLNFDDHNIKRNKIGDYRHLLFPILNVDETDRARGVYRRLYEPYGEVRAHPSRP
jgi:hypothetical protein